jgi:4-hydroxybutyrate CoA-transferase
MSIRLPFAALPLSRRDWKVKSMRRTPGDPQKISAAEAARHVRSGDHVVVSGCGAAPIEFLAALAKRADLDAAYLYHATAWGPLPHLEEESRPEHLRFRGYFLPALARGLFRRRQVDYVPNTFAHLQCMYDANELRADVVAVTCSTPDEDGFCSLGSFVSYLPAAMQKARLVIGESSPNWPRTRGAAQVPVSSFDCLIDVTRAPIVSSAAEPSEEARRIAKNIVSLVPDEATIQIGRGAIPNAVAAGLAGHRDLGVHSEMVSDWVVDLAEAGVVTGSRKKSYPGEIVTSFMDGTARLYEFASRDRMLRLQPIYEVNDPDVVAREPNFIAINSAIELDLSGQINAETLDGELISGAGGLLDFALGATRAPGGKFIVAIPSTAKGGTISRIVHRLGAGAAVTVPRTLAHYVVTEHGIANLRGCTLEERARRLIAIAHPRCRDELSRAIRRTA